MLVHSVLPRSAVNGPGERVVVWFQGCDLRCPGCWNPSSHAFDRARDKDRVFHLGCGVGYYTAILAEVTGASGQVVAVEVDADLAAHARENLAAYPNVAVHDGDGTALDPGACDAMLINAGVTHPHPAWLDRLRESGRMVVPLTIGMGKTLGKGVVAKITRQGACFSARTITFVVIYSCASVRDSQLEPTLGKAMATGALMKMQSVRRDPHAPEDTCIVHGADVCLSLNAGALAT